MLSTEGPLLVTTSSCECAFRASYRLPCRHILVDGQTSYAESLVDRRWTAGYTCDALPTTTVRVSQVANTTSGAVLTSHQKYKQAMAGLASEVGMREFRERLAALKALQSAWSTSAWSTATQQEQPAVMQERVRSSDETVLLENA